MQDPIMKFEMQREASEVLTRAQAAMAASGPAIAEALGRMGASAAAAAAAWARRLIGHE